MKRPMDFANMVHIDDFNKYHNTNYSSWQEVYNLIGFVDGGDFQSCYNNWFNFKDTSLYKELREDEKV